MTTIFIYALMAVLVGLMIWLRTKRRRGPVKGNGFRILLPMFIAFPAMMISVYQLMHIPGQTYALPAFWELLVAGLLGALFGYVILLHTAYERRDDGLIYPKPNQYFKYIIIAIILIRVVLTQYLSSLGTTEISTLAITMALVYISIWRIGSFIKFRRTLSV
ncbi:CcdC protein domain-containing protein [Paenibacillus polymyxa]|uniref:CcdC protein domain-containing protein n=1 Tax=Paenibacillus polymyxa TaxID=1406 RepID=UPI0007EB5F11|nr:CcdC protein domain-containing protein [Paenibacillus polymyxa]OAZ50517.1 cytochrome C biogenesis protein CcdC [Paenibacillus polymyxa]